MSVNNEWFNNVIKKKSKDWDKWEHNNPKSLVKAGLKQKFVAL